MSVMSMTVQSFRPYHRAVDGRGNRDGDLGNAPGRSLVGVREDGLGAGPVGGPDVSRRLIGSAGGEHVDADDSDLVSGCRDDPGHPARTAVDQYEHARLHPPRRHLEDVGALSGILLGRYVGHRCLPRGRWWARLLIRLVGGWVRVLPEVQRISQPQPGSFLTVDYDARSNSATAHQCPASEVLAAPSRCPVGGGFHDGPVWSRPRWGRSDDADGEHPRDAAFPGQYGKDPTAYAEIRAIRDACASSRTPALPARCSAPPASPRPMCMGRP